MYVVEAVVEVEGVGGEKDRSSLRTVSWYSQRFVIDRDDLEMDRRRQ